MERGLQPAAALACIKPVHILSVCVWEICVCIKSAASLVDLLKCVNFILF